MVGDKRLVRSDASKIGASAAMIHPEISFLLNLTGERTHSILAQCAGLCRLPLPEVNGQQRPPLLDAQRWNC